MLGRTRRAPVAVTAPLDDIATPTPRPGPRRVRRAVLILFVLLGAVRLWWGWIADRRLAALVADLRAHGQPVKPADMAEPAIPDAQNGVYFLRRAARSYQPTPQQQREEAELDYETIPLSPDAVASIGRL